MLTLIPYAKLNLTFDIIGKLPNGYHKIESVMHEIDLHDEIQLKELKEDKIKITCGIKELENKENLAYKAALLLKTKFKIKKGAEIILKKDIPIRAGLGGGSSNA